MRRILYVVNESVLGGATISLIEMLEQMINYVYPVVVVPSNGELVTKIEDLHIKFYIVPFTSSVKRVNLRDSNSDNHAFYNNYNAAREIYKIVKEEKIELIHSNSSISNTGALAALFADVPHIWHVREFLEEDFNYTFCDKRLTTVLLKHADAVISISKCIQKAVRAKYDISSLQIYNGVNTAKYSKNKCLPKYTNDIFLAGSIIAGKGQFEAIKAFEKSIKNGIKQVKLLIVGNGDYRYLWIINRYIRNHSLEKHIEIREFQSDIQKIRDRCSYTLVCSKMEALGRVTIESMLSGNIVIGTDTGGTLELIGENNDRGFLYRQGDVNSLAQVISNAINCSIEQKKSMQKNAYQFANEMFDCNNYVNQIYSLYTNSIENYRKTNAIKREDILVQINDMYSNIDKQLIDKYIILNKNPFKQWQKQWNDLKKMNRSISEFFIEKEITSLFLYGMGQVGCRVFDELSSNGITIEGVIDKSSEYLEEVVHVVKVDEIDTADKVILVTVLDEEKKILASLDKQNWQKIWGISEIMQWIEQNCSV